MTDWDGLCAQAHPGDGLVVRTNRAVLVVPSYAEQHAKVLDRLIALVQEAAPHGGRNVARRLAALLAAGDGEDVPDLAMLAPLPGGDVAALVAGDAEVSAETEEGSVRLSGRESLTWIDRVLRAPKQIVAGGPGATAVEHPYTDLVAGIVAAGGITLRPRPDRPLVPHPDSVAFLDLTYDVGGASTPTNPPATVPAAPVSPPPPPPPPSPPEPAEAAAPPAQSTPLSAPEPATAPAPAVDAEAAAPQPPVEEPAIDLGKPASAPKDEPSAQPETPAAAAGGDFQVESLLDVEPEPRQPLPVEVEPALLPEGEQPVYVKGIHCKRGHFNDPLVQFCTVCGINMVQQTPALVDGPRPPLGVLVFDDGAVFQLDHDYVIGRQPEISPEVSGGYARPLRLVDPGGTVSRAHAVVHLHEWTVRLADHGSANGTYIASPGSNDWLPVPQNSDVVLTPGTTIKLGNRTLKYESHRGQRQ